MELQPVEPGGPSRSSSVIPYKIHKISSVYFCIKLNILCFTELYLSEKLQF